MKYYRQIKVALLVALIALICLWLYGCDTFTEADFRKSQLIKTAIFKDVKTAKVALSDCYDQMQDYSMITGNSEEISSLIRNIERPLNRTSSQFNLNLLIKSRGHLILPSNHKLTVKKPRL